MISRLCSFALGGVIGLAMLYGLYLGGMALQFERMVSAQPRTVTLAIGRFGGTDSEIPECYFNIGPGASLALHPKGEFCPLARELVGRTGVLVFVAD